MSRAPSSGTTRPPPSRAITRRSPGCGSASPPSPPELVNETCTIPLKDPGRDPREFWHLLTAVFYPVADEPLRSTMPAVLRDVEPTELVMHPSLTRVVFPDGAEEYLPVRIWDENGGNIEDLFGGTIEVTETVDPDQDGPWRTRDGRIASLGLL